MAKPNLPRLFILSLLLLIPASAQSRRSRRRVVLPDSIAASKQDFALIFQYIASKAGYAYLGKQDLPDVSVLDGFIAKLKEPESGQASSQRESLDDTIERAECVQKGPGEIPLDVYATMVSRVADELEVGAIVEERFAPQSGMRLTDADRALSRTCQGEARNEPKDRRATYRRCLGRRSALQAYLNPPPASDEAPTETCRRFASEAEKERSRMPPELSKKLSASLSRMSLRVGAPPSAFQSFVDVMSGAPPARPTRPGHNIYPRNEPSEDGPPQAGDSRGDLKTAPPPSPQTGSDTIHYEAGVQLARLVKNAEIGFTGYCYAYVKAALQRAGVVDKNVIEDARLHRHARLFAEFVAKNPGLLKRKLRKLKSPSWPLPIGAIVVWNAGVCGYSPTSGHIEIITRIQPPQACSDGCGKFQVACFTANASYPDAAAAAKLSAEKTAAQAAVARAAAAYAAKKTRSNKYLLNKQSARLASIERRLEPRVSAYVVER